MKLDFQLLTTSLKRLATLCVCSMAACAPQAELRDTKGDVRVLIPNSVNSRHTLNETELRNIEKLETLKGKYAEFYFAPRVADSTIAGKPAIAKFIKNKNGVLVPANEPTKQLAVIYLHTQKLAELDAELGVYGINQWPRKIGVAVRVEGGSRNNAFYDGRTDSLLVVPYDRNELPVGINPGILAHEHFHSLFYKIVLKGTANEDAASHDIKEIAAGTNLDIRARNKSLRTLKLTKDKLSEEELEELYKILVIRSLNEGLADYWGWMYTGDPDFIALSLPSQKERRSLKADNFFANADLPMTSVLKERLHLFHQRGVSGKMADYVIGYSYEVGTQVSRFLKSFTEVYAQSRKIENAQARKDIAKSILNVLPTIKSFAQNKSNQKFVFKDFGLELAQQVEKLNQAECEFLMGSINSSILLGEDAYQCENTEQGYKLSVDSGNAEAARVD